MSSIEQQAPTGGFTLTNSTGFKAAFERLVRENSTYYLLGFNSSFDKRNARYVRVEVRVRRPGLQVNSIDGYVAPRGKAKGPTEAPVNPNALLTAVSEAIANPIATSGVPLRIPGSATHATSPSESPNVSA